MKTKVTDKLVGNLRKDATYEKEHVQTFGIKTAYEFASLYVQLNIATKTGCLERQKLLIL